MNDATAPTRAAAGTVLLTLAAGQFLMTLDSSVMNVSIATVAKDLDTTVTGIQTAITLYTLVMASLMITGGKIGALIGRRRAFSIGCVIYAAGSLTTALAPNLAVLVLGWSFLEGIGAVLIMPAIVALVASNFATRRTPARYGIVASAGAIAVAAGPLIGGLVTTYFSWRWVFAGEVVIVAVILLVARRIARRAAGDATRTSISSARCCRRAGSPVRLRCLALGYVGLGAAQARRARVARPVADDLAHARGRFRALGVLRVGDATSSRENASR